MSATDYEYDPTGLSPDNLITGEIHRPINTKGVIPLEGAFFARSLIVEAGPGNDRWARLEPGIDYTFSPLFTRESGAVNSQVASWIVLHENYQYVRITYQVLGSRIDDDIFKVLALSTFDRNDTIGWSTMKYRADVVGNYATGLNQLGQIEAMSRGLEKVREAVEKINTPTAPISAGNIASIQSKMVELESLVTGQTDGVGEIYQAISGVEDQVGAIYDYFASGGNANTAYADGFLYNSETAKSQHNVSHDLDVDFTHCTFWRLEVDGSLLPVDVDIIREDTNTLSFFLPTPAKVFGVIRKAGDGDFTYVSPSISTSHQITHDLDNHFVGLTVWFSNDGTNWTTDGHADVEEINSRTLTVVSYTAKYVAAVICNSTPGSYVFGATDIASDYMLAHWLDTSYYVPTIWVRQTNGRYKTLGLDDSITALDKNKLRIILEEEADIRVVLHPLANVDREIDQEVLRNQSEIFSQLDVIRQQISLLGGSGGEDTSFKGYVQEVPSGELMVGIPHGLNSTILNVTTWRKLGVDWQMFEPASISTDGDNLVIIELDTPEHIRVVISKPYVGS